MSSRANGIPRLGKLGGKEGTGGGGMKEKFEKGAAEGICCPSYEGGMYPIPGGAIWGIPGVGGKREVLVTV